MSQAYGDAGVNLAKGYESVQRIQAHIQPTYGPEVLADLSAFAGLFRLDLGAYQEPVLVSGTDGVGTKILLAQESQRLDTIGIDCVAMCANDVLAQGGAPLFFLDYLAVAKNEPKEIEAIVKGIAAGCLQAEAALIGGETAEMPDLYQGQEFDLAGFCVGIADKSQILGAHRTQAGQVLIALPSSGLHSNGYSLVRKLFFKDHAYQLEDRLADGQTVLDHLLEPTKIYVKELLPQIQAGRVQAAAHITGGGLVENLERILQSDCQARIQTQDWQVPFIFELLQELGQLTKAEMLEVFNMGVGMVVAVEAEDVAAFLGEVDGAFVIGQIEARTQADQALVFEGLDR